MAVCILFAVGLGACAPSGGDDWRNGQVEDHIDPGPGEIASLLALDYLAAGGVGSLRGALLWQDRDDGLWVHTTLHAVGRAPDETIYRVDYGDAGTYVAHAYALPEEEPPFSRGNTGDPLDDPLDGIMPDDLTERPGCNIAFQRTGPGDYAGRTVGTSCPPNHPAASHAVMDIQIDNGALSIWPRDLDADGAHVAGPTAPTQYQPTDG